MPVIPVAVVTSAVTFSISILFSITSRQIFSLSFNKSPLSFTYTKPRVNISGPTAAFATIVAGIVAENGFSVCKETAVKDNHLYTVMQAVYTGETTKLSEVEAYVGQLRRSEPLTRIYIATILERLGKQLEGRRSADSSDAVRTEALIAGINEWLRNNG